MPRPSASDAHQATGAFIGGSAGTAFAWGMKRALYSNEAGQGSSPMAHSAAKTDEPSREGIVAGLEPFIDTLIVCTISALVILASGVWKHEAEDRYAMPPATVATESVGVWSLEELPAPARTDGAAWRDGEHVFMVVAADPNKRTGNDLHRIDGTVHQDGSGSHIEWGTYRGTTEPKAVDGGVYVSYPGATLSAKASDSAQPGLGKWLVTIAVWCFALSTMISWSYYGEQGVVYLGGKSPAVVQGYRLLFCGLALVANLGFLTTNTELDTLTTTGTGVMLWANIPLLFLFGWQAMKSHRDYVRRLESGEMQPTARRSLTDLLEGKDVHDEHPPVGVDQEAQPVHRHPLGGAGVPQTEADGHGAGEQQDDVPGDLLQVLHCQHPQDEEQQGGGEDHCRAHDMNPHRNEGLGRHDDDQGGDDGDDQLLLQRHRPDGCVQSVDRVAQAGDGGLLRLEEGLQVEPDDEHHGPADQEHVLGELEEGDMAAGEALVHGSGGRAPGGAQAGDDGAGAGGVGHADENGFDEVGLLLALAIEGVDGQQDRVHGGRHGGVGHQVDVDMGNVFEVARRHLQERPVIFAVVHMGNSDLAGQAVEMGGIPSFFIMRSQRNPYTTRLLNAGRTAQGSEVLDRDDPSIVRKAVRMLKEGKTMAILLDLRARTEAMSLEFLGHQANIAGGVGLIAWLSGAAVLPCRVVRTGWTRHEVEVLDEILVVRSADKGAEIERVTREALSTLSAQVMRSPEQYFWFNRRWVLEPVSSARVLREADCRAQAQAVRGDQAPFQAPSQPDAAEEDVLINPASQKPA